MAETKLEPQKMELAELLDHSKDAKCKKELVKRQKEEAIKYLEKIYSCDLERKQNPETGAWQTPLLEISDHIKETFGQFAGKLADDVGTLEELVTLYCKALLDEQKQLDKDERLKDFECCCAVSNDCLVLAKQLKESHEDLSKGVTLNEKETKVLIDAVQPVLDCYSADALYAAQKISYFVFQDVYEAESTTKLFTSEWYKQTGKEDGHVQSIFHTMQDYLVDLERYLDKSMQPRTIQALATKFSNYYLEQLMQRSTAHTSAEQPYFAEIDKALEKIEDDIDSAREFFGKYADESNKESIGTEFDFLETIHHTLTIAAGNSEDDVEGFVKLLQTSIKSYDCTYYLLGDLFHLVNPAEEKVAYDTARAMAKDLKALDSKAPASDHNVVAGLSRRRMLADQIALAKGKRNRIGDGVVGNIKSWFGKSDRSISKRNSAIALQVPKPKETSTIESIPEPEGTQPSETTVEPKIEDKPAESKTAEANSEEELRKVQAACDAATKRATEAENQLKKVKTDLAAANVRAQKAEKQIEEMKKTKMELEKMKKDLAAANAKAQKAEEQLKETKETESELEKVKKDLVAADTRAQKAEEQLIEMKKMEIELEKMKKDLAAAEEKAGDGAKQIKQLEEQLTAANNRVREAEVRAKVAESRSDPAAVLGDSVEC